MVRRAMARVSAHGQGGVLAGQGAAPGDFEEELGQLAFA